MAAAPPLGACNLVAMPACQGGKLSAQNVLTTGTGRHRLGRPLFMHLTFHPTLGIAEFHSTARHGCVISPLGTNWARLPHSKRAVACGLTRLHGERCLPPAPPQGRRHHAVGGKPLRFPGCAAVSPVGRHLRGPGGRGRQGPRQRGQGGPSLSTGRSGRVRHSAAIGRASNLCCALFDVSSDRC